MHSLLPIFPLAALALAQQQPQVPIAPDTPRPAGPLTLDTIPRLGYGTWNLKGDNVSDAVSLAIQTGYRHIDCAAIYRNEKEVGRGIADGLAKAGLQREDIWVTSKLWNDHHGAASNVEAAIRQTLSDLDLTYLDLYHMHWPVSSTPDPEIEYLDTWDAMTTLLPAQQNLTRHLGISNFSPAQVARLLAHSPTNTPSVHQMELHPYLPQTAWLAFHRLNNIHVTAYSPFAGTNPTYSPGATVPLLSNPVITKLAEKRDCTPAQVALAWGLARGTSVIPKAQHAEYIESNFEVEGCELKEKDLKAVDGLGAEPKRFNDPSKSWGVGLYKGLEDAGGK